MMRMHDDSVRGFASEGNECPDSFLGIFHYIQTVSVSRYSMRPVKDCCLNSPRFAKPCAPVALE